jgi:hypothetical protein
MTQARQRQGELKSSHLVRLGDTHQDDSALCPRIFFTTPVEYLIHA